MGKKVEKLQEEVDKMATRIAVLEAQLYHRYELAHTALKRAKEKYKGSALILTVTDLSGEVVVRPVALKNGLSDASIAALQQDLTESARLALMNSPPGVLQQETKNAA
jgi:galactitol-specific phosphotransferase system IIB component